MASVCRVPIQSGEKIEILAKHGTKVQNFLRKTRHVFKSENELRNFIAGVIPASVQASSTARSAST